MLRIRNFHTFLHTCLNMKPWIRKIVHLNIDTSTVAKRQSDRTLRSPKDSVYIHIFDFCEDMRTEFEVQ